MYAPLFVRLLLVLAMLFAQAGSLAHGISHVLTEKTQGSEQSLPHDKYCDQCEAYAQIGGAVGSSSFTIPASSGAATLHFIPSTHFTSRAFVAFAARAPPQLS